MNQSNCAISVCLLFLFCLWPWKMVLARVCYLFYQPMDKEVKTWPLLFPAKEKPKMEKALFDWPIMLQYEVKAKYRLISRKFSSMKVYKFSSKVRLTNQIPRMFVSVWWTNQIAPFLFDEPIKLRHFCLFVVSVLFVHFYFKVIQKSL